MNDARSLRVSDEEREHVVSLLQRAVGRGALDIDEFGERVDLALAATVRADLNRVLLDLPGLTHPDRPASGPPARTAGAAPAPVTEASGSRIRATLATVKRQGPWTVPPRITVEAVMGQVELDFTEATLAGDRVEIALEVVAGSVEMRVPLGSRIERGDVALALASVDVRRKLRSGGDGPVFVLTGSVRVGSVDVRPPRRR